MKKLLFTAAFCFFCLSKAQSGDREITYEPEKIYLTPGYQEWKVQYLSEIKRAKLLVNKAHNIRVKYSYKTRSGRWVVDMKSLSKNDRKIYDNYIAQIHKIIDSFDDNPNYRRFENEYFARLPLNDMTSSAELYNISQFLSNAY